MAKNGLHLITPTSIAYTGTSASISANGSVTFSAVSSLSLNGVFTADYDNYMVVVRHIGTSSDTQFAARLRSAGTDATGANYVEQYLVADSTTVAGARSASVTNARVILAGNTTGGDQIMFYGPYLSQPTAMRNVNVQPRSSGSLVRILDFASTHSLSTSYDGVTFTQGGTSTLSGRVAVYGMRK